MKRAWWMANRMLTCEAKSRVTRRRRWIGMIGQMSSRAYWGRSGNVW